MIDSASYSGTGSTSVDRTHVLFGQTMEYSAPLIAASIFLDALNVLQFFLRIFSRDNR